ncbi:MAG: hypothetical protein L0338_27860 [Acidobacteria bacterium]|nr:hypothetical protein [Acidobacteriota bacterium]
MLSPTARRRSLQLKLSYIEEKIVRVQGELMDVEREVSVQNPTLFAHDHLGVKALKYQLEYLERVAGSIREELRRK